MGKGFLGLSFCPWAEPPGPACRKREGLTPCEEVRQSGGSTPVHVAPLGLSVCLLSAESFPAAPAAVSTCGLSGLREGVTGGHCEVSHPDLMAHTG